VRRPPFYAAGVNISSFIRRAFSVFADRAFFIGKTGSVLPPDEFFFARRGYVILFIPSVQQSLIHFTISALIYVMRCLLKPAEKITSRHGNIYRPGLTGNNKPKTRRPAMPMWRRSRHEEPHAFV
jgi:hypothetical protein